jgi:DNA topoisomerase-1
MTTLSATDGIQQAKEAARAAGLRYLSDTRPGIRREAAGDGFRYVAPDGTIIEDEATLARIKALAIPPAYTDVWISPLANSHLQATGHDAKGRKQYRYHPKWRAFRDENKYDRMMAFGAALPRIRERVARDLARPGLPREKVLATIVRLLETTFIRVGNEQYAQENQHYGLTTLHNEHVEVAGTTLQFHFVGKSGKAHQITLHDRRLARIVARLRDLPGEELFEYQGPDGQPHKISSDDVNAYLHEIAGDEFTAKDFRTWAGTVLAALALQELEAFDSQTQAKKNVMAAIKSVAERLGNTPAVCRKCYVHPEVLASYLDGSMAEGLKQVAEQELADDLHTLRPEEAAVMALLQQRLAREAVTAPARHGERKAA